ncbi:MAG: response regulator [Chitinispirillales bacterium]|jgi:putative two-component system response regulator|nr:response regulator [Chitinispirillales bacterium]
MRKTIFLVDDNATNLTMAEETLSQHYRVIALSSAAAMFKALNKFRPDLILLDIEMPEMNGFDAMEQLKANNAYADVPVMFLSGRTETECEARAIEMGAVDFIMKPFLGPELLDRVKNRMDSPPISA